MQDRIGTGSMLKIVISYRRRDTGAITGRIFDRLVAHYGRDAVFLDIDNIPPGIDFRAHITDALAQCDILLAMVGPNWAGRSGRARRARIDDENDFVRIEVETALQRCIPVIPVLLASSKMPSADQVPEGLKEFVYRQAVWVDPGRDFEHHVNRLMREIDRISLRRSDATAPQPEVEASRLALPDKSSIAVLPFANISGDPEQEYFTDGMVEEITTAIARLPWLFVIARNSAFTYKGKPVGVKQVAQELGVRYVLEGSVRKAGNRVRITGQLIDTATGAHIWADRFDGALDDIFELQDQVASSVAGAIEPKLRQSEIERASRKPTANLTAYDLYLRALAQSYRFTDEGVAEALVLARQALAIDPSYAPAAAVIGRCRRQQRVQGWGTLSNEDIGEACRLSRQALEVERDDAETISQAAFTLFLLAGEVAMVAAALDRVLALNPNAAHAWMTRGYLHALRNQPEAAIEACERARRLSPFDPYAFFCAGNIAIAHLAARRFEQAIEWADRALHDQPRFVPAMRVKIAASAHLGRLEEARAELNRMLAAVDPKLTIAGFRAYAHFMAPEVLELYVTGLRLAGLPE
jgi:adenylate cyclase